MKKWQKRRQPGNTEPMRKQDDAHNIEGSGFGYGDRVVVDHCGEASTRGVVESIHTSGKKIDVRIDHVGHKEHGRVVTFSPDCVKAA